MGILLSAAALLRLPWRAQVLNNWDSANFALGMEHFDFANHQPHPPGYLLYIAAAKIIDFLVRDANDSLVLLSVISLLLAAYLIYRVGQMIFGQTTGIVAAFLLVFSPLVWFQSEVALSYAVELPLVILATGLLYQLFFYRRYAVITGIVLAVAGGFRTDVLVFLGPIWLIGIFRMGLRTTLWALGAAVVGTLSWLAPLIYLSGGLSQYYDVSKALYATVAAPTNVMTNGILALKRNLLEVVESTLWVIGVAAPLLLLLPLAWLKINRATGRRLLFLLLIAMPAPIVFLFEHIGHPAYVFIFSGSLILALAQALVMVSEVVGRRLAGGSPAGRPFFQEAPHLVAAVLVLAICAGNTFLFVKASSLDFHLPFVQHAASAAFIPLSGEGIQNSEKYTAELISTARRFSASDTMVVNAYPYDLGITDWRRLMYYLPEYKVGILWLTAGSEYSVASFHVAEKYKSTRVTIDGNIHQILFIGLDQSQTRATLEPLPAIGNVSISLMRLSGHGDIIIGPYTIAY